MITKYKASAGYSISIERVECIRETETMVWLATGRGRKKLTTDESYFDTFEQAKAHLVEIGEAEVTRARLALNRANGRTRQRERELRQGLTGPP